MPGPHGVPRADIVALLHKGHSDRYIGRTLHTNPKRAARIRAELGLPKSVRIQGTAIEHKWNKWTHAVTGGHIRWTGAVRGITPNLVHRKRNYSARRVGFQLEHGRLPVGRVLPGCGQSWCVAPAHATDEPMRRADAMYRLIFGRAV
jgi:hypothetical protein